MSIQKMAIYPPVGIARVGNSEEFFLASEIPGQPPVVKDGFKDDEGRVKKQAVLFRIYALDENGKAKKEITSADGATITWRVHIANRKAGWYQFQNALDLPGLGIPGQFRNLGVSGSQRKQLIIDPGPKTISGKNTSGPSYRFTDGKFFGKEVPLGEVRTDEQGRLIVLGGDGHSAPNVAGTQATTFANNDGWHDDVSDGTVRATVVYDGVTYEADAAMVVCTPPNFGQGLFAVVTMYDVVTDLFLRSNWIKGPGKVNFYEHIYPILDRTVQTQWVNQGFYVLFGQNSPSDFTKADMLKKLSNPSNASKALRMKIFNWYRKPDDVRYEPSKIPPFYGDAFGDYAGLPNVDLPLTLTQYERMQQWAEGNFETGFMPKAVRFGKLNPQQQVEALTRAPLEECLGGPFHPGIEITWPFRNLIFWQEAYRIKLLPENQDPKDNYGPLLSPSIALGKGGPLDGSGPGSLTRWLGVPWQTDEASCLSGYASSYYLTLPSFWAARVPNQILSEQSFQRLADPTLNDAQRLKHFDYRQDWLRDFGTQYIPKINAMVSSWHELGIIAAHPMPSNSDMKWLPEQLWVESNRKKYNDPTFEQVKEAENANKPAMKKTQLLLNKVAGRAEDEVQPIHESRIFRRDEM